MSSILTNTSAMVALDTLRSINNSLETVQNEISTGKTVNSAKDNAAVWAISTVMSTDVDSFEQISESLSVGSSTVGVATSAAEEVTSLLQDMKELIVQAQQDLNDSDRATIQTDIDNLTSTISTIVSAAQFNGVNLLEGTDSMSILASLDRGSDGSVSASYITVERQDLSTTAAVDAADKESSDAGYMSTADTASTVDVDKTSTDAGYMSTAISTSVTDGNSGDVTIAAGDIAEGDTYTINVGGSDYTYTASSGDTINDVANGLKTLIDAGSISNLTVTVTEGTDPSVDDATITFAASGGDVTFDESALAATSESEAIADGDDIDVSIAGGDIAEGDTFTINAGGSDFTYTAADGDTINDVADGLKTLIDAGSVSGLTVTVTEAADPSSDAATINLAASGSDVYVDLSALNAQDAATAAGGLAAAADIDVSTAAGATEALSTIEDLLDTAISAAAAFGSSQTQIETQSGFVSTLVDALNTGIGALVDSDIEAASAKLTAIQTQQQLAVEALTIANQSPSVLLSLFQ